MTHDSALFRPGSPAFRNKWIAYSRPNDSILKNSLRSRYLSTCLRLLFSTQNKPIQLSRPAIEDIKLLVCVPNLWRLDDVLNYFLMSLNACPNLRAVMVVSLIFIRFRSLWVEFLNWVMFCFRESSERPRRVQQLLAAGRKRQLWEVTGRSLRQNQLLLLQVRKVTFNIFTWRFYDYQTKNKIK